MFFKKKIKKKFFSVDIGTQNSKFMSLQPGKKPQVDHLIMLPTPQGAFKDNAIVDEKLLADFLAETIGGLDIETEISLILGISSKGVIAKKMDIPNIEASLIREFIQIEAEQELFYNKDSATLDYETLEGLNFEKPNEKSLFVVTVPDEVIEKYNSAVPQELMSCDILDTNFAALFNSFEYNYDLDSNKNYMLVDIGCSSTNVVCIIKNQIVFSRILLNSGGNFWTDEIKSHNSVDYASAEDLKIAAGGEDSSPQEVASLIQSKINPAFVEEVKSTYNLYLSLFPDYAVNEIYMSGGASKTLQILESFKEGFSCEVYAFDPFKKLDFMSHIAKSKAQYQEFFAVASGLILRSLDD